MEKEHHTADFTLSFRKSSTNPSQSKAFPHLHHGSVLKLGLRGLLAKQLDQVTDAEVQILSLPPLI